MSLAIPAQRPWWSEHVATIDVDKTKIVLGISGLVAVILAAVWFGGVLKEHNQFGERLRTVEGAIVEMRLSQQSLESKAVAAASSADKAFGEARLANLTLEDIKIAMARRGFDVPTSTQIGGQR